ncbi:SDR family NAD(P)-dependent oxidoreductase [Promicromonospora panici]|uniref:SDR family NAD(P)-dependent oxidoreductase n=1 Tax=Promicromonospora panici TaxID=2219658 RepID=UPI00101D1A64|nr:SDR family oxidoreductase [Promicromonospora panici]
MTQQTTQHAQPGYGRRLQDRTALVTGSTRNIGRSIVQALAAEGAHVVVSGRNVRRGEEVVAGIRERGGKADFVASDLDGSPEASHALAGAAADVLGGRIDILVNNAGIYSATVLADTDSETFDSYYAVNVKAPFFLTQAVAPHMVADGGGAIINLGSWAARLALPVGGLYASTKGALETLTRAWAAELGPQGVRVNAVSPGVIRPPELDPSVDFAGGITLGTPAGGPGHPDAIGAAVVYLASDDAKFVHGTVLDVDGGRMGVAVIADPGTITVPENH